MARPRPLACLALLTLLALPGPCTVVATEQHGCSADGDCMEDHGVEEASALLQRTHSSPDMMSSGKSTLPNLQAKMRALKKLAKLNNELREFMRAWPLDVIERGLEMWELVKNFVYQVPNVTVPSDEEIAGALPPDITPRENRQGVTQGMAQVMKSLMMMPILPTAAQVEAACPAGEDCTRSAVVDVAKSQALFTSSFEFLPDLPSNNHMGMCYNAPYYYANACIASGVSPNAKAAMINPQVVKGTTCEELGYQRWPAYYADPFYGWKNNVSLFVNWGLLEWVPMTYLIASCRDCLMSLMFEGWGMEWRKKNPKCAR